MTPKRLREIAAMYAADAADDRQTAVKLRLIAANATNQHFIDALGPIDPVAYRQKALLLEQSARKLQDACNDPQDFSFSKGGWS